ncbi:hypothetical protein [Kribbella flavida]|nr:hypothetical protein [Kribbella flavida]
MVLPAAVDRGGSVRRPGDAGVGGVVVLGTPDLAGARHLVW